MIGMIRMVVLLNNLRMPHEMFFIFLFHRGNLWNLRIGILRGRKLL